MNNEITYHEPTDPFHITYYYAADTDLEYDNRWEKLREGQEEEIHTTHIIVGPEGIAAEVELTPQQGEWVPDKEHYFPHITLALTGEHAPASLGKMMARAKQATWIKSLKLKGNRRFPNVDDVKIAADIANLWPPSKRLRV